MKQKIVVTLFIFLIISVFPQVFAEEDLEIFLNESNGILVEQQKMIFEIGRHSDIRVKHVIETGKWDSEVNNSRVIGILPGQHTNLSVVDEDGSKMPFFYDGQTFEESKYIALTQKLGNYDLIVEYDLDNYFEIDNNLWSKNIKYPFDITMMIEDDIDLIFANSRPVNVSDANGINCVGCQLKVEFFDSNNTLKKLISFNEKEIPIEVISNGNISELEYSFGETNLINFNVDDSEQLIILKIPFELLLNPFEVYFTEENDINLDQTDKIRKTEFNQEGSQVSVSFRTSSEGVVSITGATIEKHEKLLDQIRDRILAETKSEIVEEEKSGVALPIPGTGQPTNNPSETMISEKEELSFADELSKEQTLESSQDYTIILAIIGIIAAIIIGIIVKVKKN